MLKAGIKAAAIHGNKGRARTSKQWFQRWHANLVATDIAARGLDIHLYYRMLSI
jgi:superfamily II DNA/RNA helicase